MLYNLCKLSIFFAFLNPTLCPAQLIILADSLYKAGKYAGAISEYNKILSPGTKTATLATGNIYMRKGTCYYLLQKNDSALQNYFSALGIFDTLKNTERLAAVTSNIAGVYYANNDLHSAEKYWQYAFEYSKNLNDTSRLLGVVLQKGFVLFENGKEKDALALYHQTLKDYNRKMSDNLSSRYFINLGYFLQHADNDSSIIFFKQAETFAEKDNDSSLLCTIYGNLGNAYTKARDFHTALVYLQKSQQITEAYSDTLQLSYTYHNLADVYDSLSIYKSALFYSRKASQTDKILFDADKMKTAAELSEKYESGKKDEKIKSQEIESRLKNRNLLLSLSGLGLAIALAALSFISYRRKQKANRLLLAQNQRIENLNRELDNSNQVKTRLFSVISHDIRSPISSLYAYLQLKNKSPDDSDAGAIIQAEHLLDTLEDLLIWSKSQLHQFVPSVEKVYLRRVTEQIEQLLLPVIKSRHLKIVNSIPDELFAPTDSNMLSIIIRNLLSNAVKFSAAATTISITAEQDAAAVTVKISNQPGEQHQAWFSAVHESTVTSNSSGLGILLVKEFVTKLGGSASYALNNNCITAIITLPRS